MAEDIIMQSVKAGKGGVEISYLTRRGEKKRPVKAPKKARGRGKLSVEDGGQAPAPAQAPTFVEAKHSESCKDEPHPDFTAALNALREPCVGLLELPDRYVDNLTVVGIHLSEQKGGCRGLVVNLVKTLTKSQGRPFNIATPLVVELKAKADQTDAQEELWGAVDRIIGEAIAYIGGKRPQLSLEFDEAAQSAEAAVGAL